MSYACITDTGHVQLIKNDSIEEKSLLFFYKLGLHGFSQEEIIIRRLRGSWCHIYAELDNQYRTLYPNSYIGASHTIIPTGSSCEGLEGNSNVKFTPNDQDWVFLDIGKGIKDGNAINLPYKGLHDKINNETLNDILMEDDASYPGYVRLFTVDNNGKFYFKRIDSYEVVKIYIDTLGVSIPIKEYNGPAVTFRHFNNPDNGSLDFIHALQYKGWPAIANEWLTRERPNNWPSKDMITLIKSEGCIIAPVGHHDCQDHIPQWRIAFKGEHRLVFQLNHIQCLCYVILKLILKLNLKKISNNVLSSFHVKNVIFWCAENLSCNWTPLNLLQCIRGCIIQFKTCVANHNLPHYIIKKRNLFHSELTTDISKDVCRYLDKYEKNILNVFKIKISTLYRITMQKCMNIAFLESSTIDSAIVSCFHASFSTFETSEGMWRKICETYNSNNVTESLKLCRARLGIITKHNYIYAAPCKYLLESIIGMLSFIKFQKTQKRKYLKDAEDYFILKRKQITDSPPILLRFVIYLFMRNEFKDALHYCSKCVFRPIRRIGTNERSQYLENELRRLKILTVYLTAEERVVVKEKIVRILKCSNVSEIISRGFFQPASEILSAMKDLSTFIFLCVNWGVPLMRVEKQIAPDVLLFEILSANPGIIISTRLCCLLMKYLIDSKMDKLLDNSNILVSMDFYLEKRNLAELKQDSEEFETFYHQIRKCVTLYHQNSNKDESYCINTEREVTDKTRFQLKQTEETRKKLAKYECVFEEMYQAYNIVAYCNLKARRYDKASYYILKSLKIFPSHKNAAYGYLKIITSH